MTDIIHPRTAAALAKRGWRYDPENHRVIVQEAYEGETPIISYAYVRDTTSQLAKIEVPTGETQRIRVPPVHVPAARRSDGRWIAAVWEDPWQQWLCWDLTPAFKRANPYTHCAAARRLDDLVGVRTYRSLVELVKAQIS